MKELILATSNAGKIAELQLLLSPVRCISKSEFGIESPEETGLSFIENAILKARFASRLTKKPALADDSGLVVLALGGQPGIFSARFAGMNASDQDNIDLLLKKMAAVKDERRQAFFYCALALVQHADDPTPIIATGKFSGLITRESRGTGGFGYDPVMYLTDYQCTVAELPSATKNTISHRAIALKKLREQLADEISSDQAS